MTNLASPNEGAKLILASSNDERHPPDAVIDGNPSTFWLTSGIFPQQFILSFRSLVAIDMILMRCTKVHRVRIERSEKNKPADFQALTEKDAEVMDEEIQLLKIELPKTTASFLKIIITHAFDHFVSVHSLIVTGNTVR